VIRIEKTSETIQMYFIRSVMSIVIAIVFTFIDFIFPHMIKAFEVSDSYYINKLIYSPILIFLALTFIKNKDIYYKSALQSVAVALVLQLRYVFYYNLLFNVVVTLSHIVILYVLIVAYNDLKNKEW